MNTTSSKDQPVPSWPDRLIAELDDADRRAIGLARGATVTELNWRPSPTEWSVGQCLEHLCITGEVYLAAIRAALDGRARGTSEDISPGWFGRWFIRTAIEPSEHGRRYRAPRKIAPPDKQVDAAILDRFLDGNARTREVVHLASGYDVNRVRFRNPLVPLIRFTVGTGLLIVVRHEHRHLLQAERVKRRAESAPVEAAAQVVRVPPAG